LFSKSRRLRLDAIDFHLQSPILKEKDRSCPEAYP
jgi:hypothetical protein